MRPEFAARARVGFLAANWTQSNSNTTWPSVKFTKWIFYYIFPLLCLYYGILFSWELLDMIPFYYALYYIEFSLTFPIIFTYLLHLTNKILLGHFFPYLGRKECKVLLKSSKIQNRSVFTSSLFLPFSVLAPKTISGICPTVLFDCICSSFSKNFPSYFPSLFSLSPHFVFWSFEQD